MTHINRLSNINIDMVNKYKKMLINEGRAISNGKFAYGGFPRIINEAEAVTHAFQDSPDQNQQNVATLRNDQEDPITWQFVHNGFEYPSQTMVDFQKQLDTIGAKLKPAHEKFREQYGPVHAEKHMMGDPEVSALMRQWKEVGSAMRAHPHHKELVLGHPAKRRELTGEEQQELRGYGAPGTGSRWTGD
jgi:hypothetical protein